MLYFVATPRYARLSQVFAKFCVRERIRNVASRVCVIGFNVGVGSTALLLALSAHAQQPLPSPDLLLTRNAVIGSYAGSSTGAVAVQADGKLLVVLADGARVGGSYANNDYSGVDKHSLLRLNRDGTLDTTFTLDVDEFAGVITYVRIFGNFAYVVGPFTSIAGVPRAGLARINLTTNSVDVTWNPNPVSRLAGQAAVEDIALDAQGNLYTFGGLYDIGGKSSIRVAKIPATSANGQADPNFDGRQGGIFQQSEILSERILASPVPGGPIYLMGRLTTLQPALNYRVYRYNATTGLPDTNWSPDLTAIDMLLLDVAIDSAGDLYLAGVSSGNQVVNQNVSSPYSLVKINGATGQVPMQWTGGRNQPFFPQGASLPSYTVRQHAAVAVDSTGVYVNRAVFYSDFSAYQPGKLDLTTGEPVAGFNSAPAQGGNIIPQVVVPTPDGIVYGGDLNYFNNQRVGALVRLDRTSGAALSGFSPNIKTLGYVSSSTKLADGRVILGGTFTEANGVAINNLLRLDRDGNFDPTFTNGPLGQVTAVKDIAGGLYVSGVFNFVGQTPRLALAKFDSQSGTLDQNWAPAVDGVVRGFTGDANGIYTIGGTYVVNGTPGRCVAKLSPSTGALDVAWSPAITNIAAGASCGRSIQKVGQQIYLGFGGTTGPTTSPPRILVNAQPRPVVRVDAATGVVDPSFDVGISAAATMLEFDGTNLWVGTNALSFAGVPTARLAKITAAGTVDTSFVVRPADLPSSVLAIRASANGVFVATTSQLQDFRTQLKVLKFSPSSGALDTGFAPAVDPYLLGVLPALELLPGNRLVVGAGFDHVGNQRRLGVAAFSQFAPKTLTLTVNGKGTVDATSNGATANVQCFDCKGGPFTYEFDTAATVTLTAKPLPGWVFVGWKGDNGAATCTSVGPCVLSLTTSTNVSASFRNVANYIEQ